LLFLKKSCLLFVPYIEKLDPKEKRQITMLIDTFIKKDRLRERAKTA